MSGQPWACVGAEQGQMQPLQSATCEEKPELGAPGSSGQVGCGGCSFPGLVWSFLEEEEAVLGNLSAQRLASV